MIRYITLYFQNVRIIILGTVRCTFRRYRYTISVHYLVLSDGIDILFGTLPRTFRRYGHNAVGTLPRTFRRYGNIIR